MSCQLCLSMLMHSAGSCTHTEELTNTAAESAVHMGSCYLALLPDVSMPVLLNPNRPGSPRECLAAAVFCVAAQVLLPSAQSSSSF